MVTKRGRLWDEGPKKEILISFRDFWTEKSESMWQSDYINMSRSHLHLQPITISYQKRYILKLDDQ